MPGHAAVAAIYALGTRDLRRYFNNPTGYVFITLFILLSAAAAFWRPRFFLNSLANLDQLNDAFPHLLLFFVPALAMGLWADERKHGTDELLLTLPATEWSIVVGKFVAAAGIYAVALLVSLSHAMVLAWLGSPDPGLLAANYLGFWAVGTALIPVAMLGSLLTANTTIALILGALLCAVPVGIGDAAATASDAFGRRLAPLSVAPYFGDFARGIVSASSVLYFVCVGGFFLYLNVLVLERRHRRPDSSPVPAWIHVVARVVALAVALGCLVVLAGRAGGRLDLTAERLTSLSDRTAALIAAVPPDRPVLIRAFVSPDIPEPLVPTRENVIGLLREIEARGGAKVLMTIQATEPYSDEAKLARERYNIVPRDVVNPSTGESVPDIYLGVAVTSGAEEEVIPFFERGMSPEYELARAIQVVSRGQRKRLGIVDADVKMLGGVDYRTNQPRPAWAIVRDLRRQYDVVEVTPAGATEANVDVLLAVLPSRMTQTDLDAAFEPIRRGVPTLVLLDPLPVIDMRLAPAADVASQIDPYRPAPSVRLIPGDFRTALANVGINWVPASIVWDAFNPHPDLTELPRETVFVAEGNGNPDAISRRSPATAGLQEILLLYPGHLLPVDSPDFTFEPLLQTGRTAGSSSFFDLVRPTPTGMALNASLPHEPDNRRYVLAARVRSARPLSARPGSRPADVVAVADIDFISDSFFGIRAAAQATANFDNIAFFSNAIDLLAGDESFIALRNRRSRHRTLERLEAQTRTFMEQRAREEQEAQKEGLSALDEARGRLQKRIDALNARTDLDAQAKQIMLRTLEETETRQLRVLEDNIVRARDARIRASRETMEMQIRTIRTRIRTLAVLLPPVPVLLLGVALFARRARREREGARVMGRLRQGKCERRA